MLVLRIILGVVYIAASVCAACSSSLCSFLDNELRPVNKKAEKVYKVCSVTSLLVGSAFGTWSIIEILYNPNPINWIMLIIFFATCFPIKF